ncbi:NhaP-type Na+/H+ and K+/H+ antiporter with a unique C-terminal domain protein [Rubidibacter lacunae KORDI 51-2]|uniref:NhaP-type Na+/H+ and K+/H+ antiporter with a unique C-terminal domain protein n=1 Tax=Rubidibacter lacunae KORDI 51-2 TaxID=582515 RepID=U5DI79_9CHRO|nr:potassium/proton antiporter [Rubidibacter lacunae]ERN41376.1 NhaP-type Na+/H+ and K+/H+ antiporter with a unique C-terminal domain protein [Rubidibacter lacunae KORDI 51-2]
MPSLELFCFAAGLLLILSVAASKLSTRFGVPGLLIFLLIGMLAGSEGIGGIYFDNYQLAKTIGDIALMFILFNGGMETQWRTIQPVLGVGLVLSTLGVALTTLILGTFAWAVLGSFSSFDFGLDGISWLEGLLLGAIVSSTDAAAVFSILKSDRSGLKGHLKPLLELESGSNDPMAVLLTDTLVKVLAASDPSSTGLMTIMVTLLLRLGVATLVGYGIGLLMSWTTNRFSFDTKELYPVLTVGRVLLIYGIATLLQGNGFLAIYVAGVVLGNQRYPFKEEIASFMEGNAWIMQISMFLVLGLLVFPSQLLGVAPVAIAIALFLMFIARPLSVFIGLALARYSWQEKTFVSWVGLRGAVPIILAIAPISAGLDDSRVIFNLVFFIVLISVSVQGLTLTSSARWLKLTNDV